MTDIEKLQCKVRRASLLSAFAFGTLALLLFWIIVGPDPTPIARAGLRVMGLSLIYLSLKENLWTRSVP